MVFTTPTTFSRVKHFSQDLICNTPYCLPYNSYNAMSVNLVLDQLIILQFLSFLSHLIQDFEALYDTRMKLRRWESITGLLSIINWVDNANWPPLRVSKLTFRAFPLVRAKHHHSIPYHHSLWRRANARNVSFETLYGGQFMLSTQY